MEGGESQANQEHIAEAHPRILGTGLNSIKDQTFPLMTSWLWGNDAWGGEGRGEGKRGIERGGRRVEESRWRGRGRGKCIASSYSSHSNAPLPPCPPPSAPNNPTPCPPPASPGTVLQHCFIHRR